MELPNLRGSSKVPTEFHTSSNYLNLLFSYSYRYKFQARGSEG